MLCTNGCCRIKRRRKTSMKIRERNGRNWSQEHAWILRQVGEDKIVMDTLACGSIRSRRRIYLRVLVISLKRTRVTYTYWRLLRQHDREPSYLARALSENDQPKITQTAGIQTTNCHCHLFEDVVRSPKNESETYQGMACGPGCRTGIPREWRKWAADKCVIFGRVSHGELMWEQLSCANGGEGGVKSENPVDKVLSVTNCVLLARMSGHSRLLLKKMWQLYPHEGKRFEWNL